MLVHTEMGFMPENISRQKCHLQPVEGPNPKGPHSSARIGGWMGSLPSTQRQPQIPPQLLGGTGAHSKSTERCSKHPLALLSALWQGSELPFLSLAIANINH